MLESPLTVPTIGLGNGDVPMSEQPDHLPAPEPQRDDILASHPKDDLQSNQVLSKYWLSQL